MILGTINGFSNHSEWSSEFESIGVGSFAGVGVEVSEILSTPTPISAGITFLPCRKVIILGEGLSAHRRMRDAHLLNK